MTTQAPALAPRPATEISPPMQYALPQRQFLTKTERRALAMKGESTLPPKRPPYVAPPERRETRVWDPQKRMMVPIDSLKTDYSKLPSDLPTEYHLSIGKGTCKIYTPCSKRPCYEDDHVDLDGKVVRWKGTTRNVQDIPFPDAPHDGAGADESEKKPTFTPSPVLLPTSAASSVSRGTAPRLGPSTDIMPRFQVGTDGVCSPIGVSSLPRLYLRGTKRWLGQVLPSFRPPM